MSALCNLVTYLTHPLLEVTYIYVFAYFFLIIIQILSVARDVNYIKLILLHYKLMLLQREECFPGIPKQTCFFGADPVVDHGIVQDIIHVVIHDMSYMTLFSLFPFTSLSFLEELFEKKMKQFPYQSPKAKNVETKCTLEIKENS